MFLRPGAPSGTILLPLVLLGIYGVTVGAPPATLPSSAALDCPGSSEDIVVHENVVFAAPEGRELRLDLYVRSNSPDPVRLIVLVHDAGGSDETFSPKQDSKEALACLASALASNGFAAATVEYRTPYERLYPAALDDVLAAVRWLRANGESYGLNIGSVGVAGQGFGGYVAALVGLSTSQEVQAVAAINAPMDLSHYRPPPGYPYLHHIFLGFPRAQRPDLWREASPIHRVRRDAPPFLLLHGTADERVPFDQAVAMREALEGADGWVRIISVDDAGKDYFDADAGRKRAVEEFTRFFDRFLWVPPPGVELKRDIVYASPEGRDVHLDLFRPKDIEGRLPAVIFLHGGGWIWGGRRDMWPEAAELASHGFITASVEYRKADERIYPAAVDDAKAAVRWLRAHAGELGIETDRLGAVGSSAGGHLAALLGVTPHRKYLGESAGPAEPSAAIQGVVLIRGVVDMVALNPRDRYSPAAFLGVPPAQNPKLWAEASPINHVGPDAAAFLFLHGTEDELGSHAEMVNMAARLRSVGVRGDVFSAEGGQHDFWSHDQWRDPGMRALIKFLKETLGSGR